MKLLPTVLCAVAIGLLSPAAHAQDSGFPCKVSILPNSSTPGKVDGHLKCSRTNNAGRTSAASAAGAGGSTFSPQTTPAPAQPQQPAQPQSAAQKFPYPGEAPAATSAPDAPAPTGSSQSSSPQSPTPQSAAKRFPYPGEPADPGAPAHSAADGAWSSSSSSSSAAGDPAAADDSSNSPLKDAGSNGESTTEPNTRNARRRLPKVNAKSTDERVAEDLEVADFYQKDGNFAAAYARAKDAVSLMPNDPGGHLALAEAARKLGKRDEAKAEYALVLTLDPAPKELKATRQGMAELNSGKK